MQKDMVCRSYLSLEFLMSMSINLSACLAAFARWCGVKTVRRAGEQQTDFPLFRLFFFLIIASSVLQSAGSFRDSPKDYHLVLSRAQLYVSTSREGKIFVAGAAL